MKEMNCTNFLEALSSKDPVPGGGGASAYVGAIGMALGNMVGNLTLGKPKYAEVQDEIKELLEQGQAIQSELMDLVEKDAQVFLPLSQAYGLPSGTPEEKAAKEKIMEAALISCCEIPLEMMVVCGKAIDCHQRLEKIGTAIAISDVGVGVIASKSALQGAALNVFINTKAMKNRDKAEEYNQKAQVLLEHYLPLGDEIYQKVVQRFSN